MILTVISGVISGVIDIVGATDYPAFSRILRLANYCRSGVGACVGNGEAANCIDAFPAKRLIGGFRKPAHHMEASSASNARDRAVWHGGSCADLSLFGPFNDIGWAP